MKLHRDLNINQRSAWFLARRLRTALAVEGGLLSGPAEAGETYFGSKHKNMSNTKKKKLKESGAGRGADGKTAVVGIKDRAANQVRAQVAKNTDKLALHGFVSKHTDPSATVYTDDAKAYEAMQFNHETVTHSLSEYVRSDIHTNGIEILWSMLKHAYNGIFHKIGPKHLDRYVQAFAARHSLRDPDAIDIMVAVVTGMCGKRITHNDLIANNGPPSGARS